ncbi:MAG: excinuclease ABC subunit UvrA [Isosphaeraceae bacterium]
MPDPNRSIRLRGVRVHNLRGIDLDLPTGRWIAFSGVSGSGKSSLAFDTLFAEGQRRYIETFSPYARQFLDALDKPDADRIDGLPPAIGIGQRPPRRSGRSTVGTVTEIHEYLALLYGRAGEVFCRNCGAPVRPSGPEDVVRAILELPERARYLLAFPFEVGPDSDPLALADDLRARGFLRFRADGGPPALLEAGPLPRPDSGRLEIVVDRLVRGQEDEGRRLDSIETAFEQGLGRCLLIERDHTQAFLNGWRCGRCGLDHARPEPRLFRFNSPWGACPACEGLGVSETDGIQPPRACPDCGGTRLRPEALAVKLAGMDIAALSSKTVAEVREILQDWGESANPGPLPDRALRPILDRLDYLAEIGLEYLTLDRPARTLSGGEARRVTLTSALGSGLVRTLYVLDEPSNGLHPRDVGRLRLILEKLRDADNTLVMVEHDEALLRAADWLVEIGPGAGVSGGRSCAPGRPGASSTAPNRPPDGPSPGALRRPAPAKRRPIDRGSITIQNARGHNLKGIDVAFPLGVFCAVTGVSGAGKSTLVEETLYPALRRYVRGDEAPALPYAGLSVDGEVADLVLIDGSPIGRSGRSNPVTYLKAFDEVRRAFAQTHEAKLRNYGPGRFSFNVEGGRCNACEGNGFRTIDMQFLDDVVVRCPECRGRRFRAETLEVKYRGKDIAEVLDMTAREAFGFFARKPKVQARLRPMLDVGLDYLRLGQPASTLSGGEAQRLKLAAHLATSSASLARRAGGPRTVFLLDEPTTGLHPADVARLLDALQSLVDRGHSLIVIDHDPEILRAADWILDLGPEAGDRGGTVVATGSPEQVALTDTYTGRYLARLLGGAS